MARLLIVAHSPSATMQALLDAVLAGAGDPQLAGLEVVVRAALEAGPDDVLHADGYVLGTTANLGYMSGALKHFFDTVYNPCLEHTARRPYGLYVHGHTDTTGAVASVEKVITGLRWRAAHRVVSVLGPPGEDDLEACSQLGATLGAVVLEGLG